MMERIWRSLLRLWLRLFRFKSRLRNRPTSCFNGDPTLSALELPKESRFRLGCGIRARPMFAALEAQFCYDPRSLGGSHLRSNPFCSNHHEVTGLPCVQPFVRASSPGIRFEQRMSIRAAVRRPQRRRNLSRGFRILKRGWIVFSLSRPWTWSKVESSSVRFCVTAAAASRENNNEQVVSLEFQLFPAEILVMMVVHCRVGTSRRVLVPETLENVDVGQLL